MKYIVTAKHKATGNRVEFMLPATLKETERNLNNYLNSRSCKKKKRFSHFKIELYQPTLNL